MSEFDPNAPPGPVKKKGCMGCSWWIVIPGGCLMVCLLGCGGFFAVTYFAASSIVSKSTGFIESVDRVRKNAAVKAELGEPITMDPPTNPSINYTNGKTHLEFSAKLNGPKGSGTLHVVGDHDGSVWHYSALEVYTQKGTIDLLNDGNGKNQ